jgi:hypothetical protein
MIGGTALTVLGLILTHNLGCLFVGLGIFIVGPLLLNAQIRSFFTKKAQLQFLPDRLVIQLINEDTDVLEKTEEVLFDNVVNYRWDKAMKNDSFYFSLLLGDGRKVSYSFWPPRSAAPEDDVTAALDAYIKTYNKRASGGHTIAYRYLWFEHQPAFPKD